MAVMRCLLFFHIFATTFYLPVYLQVTGIPELTAAALVIPFLVTAGISSTITNTVAHKFGHVRPLLMISLIVLPVGMGLMSTLTETSSIGRTVGYSLVSGIGYGSGTPITMVIAQIGLPPNVLPTVTALIGAAPSLGGTFGVGIIGTIVNNQFRDTLTSMDPELASSLHLNDVVSSAVHGKKSSWRTCLRGVLAAGRWLVLGHSCTS